MAVYDTGSFTAAGRRMGLTTNAISQRVLRLEDAVGTRLFTRTTRRVAPTDEARTFHATIARVLAELEAAEDALQPGDAGLRGTVRIALPAVLAGGPLHARLGALLVAHPQLAIEIHVASRPLDFVGAGFDIAVMVGPVPASTFVRRRLGRVSWVFAATPAYLARAGRPRAPADLAAHECLRLLTSPPQATWTLVDRRGRARVVAVGGRYLADDSRALGDALYAGLGIGVRPAGECGAAVSAGRLARVLPGFVFEALDVVALVPPGRIRTPRIAACLDALQAAVAALA